ncbi:MAG: ABC transporter ATP-binding protein [Sutterella wadsworthensis]
MVSYPGLTQPPVNHLTLSIAPGSVTAVLGRSGCGKTTLLKAAAGLLLPQAGAVRFTSPNASGRTHPKVAMVFQEPLLLPWKTVRENAALALSARTGEALSEACKSAAVTQALTLAGIADLAERFPAELSGGQQQRAGLARALSAEPDVLLMDEPFGALDALTRLELQDETRALFNRRRMTVLMITHDVREALRMADRAVVLRGGSAAADHSLLMPFPRRFSDPAVGAAEEGLLAELLHH